MKLLACCFLFAIAAAPAFAAKRIQMERTDLATNKVTSREILIDTTRLRVNDGNTSILFLSSGGNRMMILDKSRNEYREIDQQTMDQMGAQMQGLSAQMEEAMKGMPPAQRAQMEAMLKGKMPAAGAATTAIVFTAKGSGTASGYSCTKYEGVRAGQKVVDLCAAQAAALKLSNTDSQVYEKMREFTAGMMKALANSPLGGMVPGAAQAGIQGFPVEETTFSNGKAMTREVLKSITDVTASDADFSTGNAKKIEMGIPAGRGARGK